MRRSIVGAVALLVAAGVAFLLMRSKGDELRADDEQPLAKDEMPAGSPEPRPSEVAPLAARGASRDGDAAGRRGANGHLVPDVDPTRRVTIRGRAVTEQGAPVAAATVEARFGLETIGGADSRDDGTFEFAVERPSLHEQAGVLVARDGHGRVGSISLPWRGSMHTRGDLTLRSTIDAGDVPLQDGVALDVQVQRADGAPAQADVMVTSAWGTAALATARTDGQGAARFTGLPRIEVHVAAWAVGVGRAATAASLPRADAAPLILVLAPVRNVTVTVVEQTSKSPIAGARVVCSDMIPIGNNTVRTSPYLPPVVAAPTDAAGRTTLADVTSTARLRVAAVADGYADATAVESQAGGVQVLADVTAVTLPMRPLRRITFAIDPGEVATPPDGTVLRLRPQSGAAIFVDVPTQARVEGGQVVVDGATPGYFYAVASTSGDTQAALMAPASPAPGQPTKFVRTPRIDVTLRWDDGTPAEGVWVATRDQGNNPTGAAARTDAQGRASLADLESKLVDVYVGTSELGAAWSQQRIATCDLTAGSATVDASLRRAREVSVHVFVDGQPGLPPELFGPPVPSNTMRIDPLGPTDLRVLSRDDASGTVRLRYAPAAGDVTVIPVDIAGYTAASPLRVPSSSAEAADVRLDLRRSGALDVQAVAPPDGRYRLRLERWDAAKRVWVGTTFDSQVYGPGQARIDPEGRWRLSTLEPGRYRVREVESAAVSDDIDIVAGAAQARLRFDLSGVGWATGRVMVPDGTAAQDVFVRVDPAPPTSVWSRWERGTLVGSDGTFKARVPGTAVMLTGQSLRLVPAREGGRVQASAGMQGLVIRMSRGPTIRVAFDRSLDMRRTLSEAPVHLWRGPTAGEPTVSKIADVTAVAAVFSVPEEGRWSAVLDLAPFAPVFVDAIDVGDGETAAGPIALSEGSSLVFEVKTSGGGSAPRMMAWAERVDGLPKNGRSANFTSSGRLSGLGRGRFHVSAGPSMAIGSGPPLLDREIDVDGTNDVPITIDVK